MQYKEKEIKMHELTIASKRIPELFEQRGSENPIAYVKYVDRSTGACWYMCEGSPTTGGDINFYGYFAGDGPGIWDHFSYLEMEDLCTRNPGRIEREKQFSPKPLREELMEDHHSMLESAILI